MALNPTHIDRLLLHSGLGQLLTRAMLGFVFFYHGAQKLFAWFGGYGIEGTAGFFEQLGIPFPTLSVYMAGSAEFFGGLLLMVGLLTRPMAVVLAGTMFVAAFSAHSGFSAMNGGMEYPLTLAVVSAALFFLGGGKLSLDALAAGFWSKPASKTTAATPAAA